MSFLSTLRAAFCAVLLVALPLAVACESARPRDPADAAPADRDPIVDAGTETGTVDGGSSDAPADTAPDAIDAAPPRVYAFPGRFGTSADSVSHDEATLRHVLIVELEQAIRGLTGKIDSGELTPAADGEVVRLLDRYFRDDLTAPPSPMLELTFATPLRQRTHREVSARGTLFEAVAGNTRTTDHQDVPTEFHGWETTSITQFGGSITTPTGLIDAFFQTIEENALAHAARTPRFGPGGLALPVHVTEDGLDLAALTRATLIASVSYAQGLDDHLDSDVVARGLRSSNGQADGALYSELEHSWDLAYGYFGASRNYLAFDAAELGSSTGFARDLDGDGQIDLHREWNFGSAILAGERDAVRAGPTPSELRAQTFEAFFRGRTLMGTFGPELTREEMTMLNTFRDRAARGWERVLAASIISALNRVLAQMALFGAPAYDFYAHATAWAQMKGLSLGLQFSPRSILPHARYHEIHEQFLDAPVLADATSVAIEAYREELLAARRTLATGFGFDAAYVGDADGAGGW